ncbi:MAG: thymidine phosphorylase [Cycloclasticus sp. symbiont of Bathymodiolus heckerae]|nr:MAG: thymidine phosphorylase [Cycloclasticus sp. symbiont of Bathymodiolus heckerae]
MNVKSVDKKNVIPATAKLLKVYLQKAVALHLEQIQQQMFDSADVEGMDSLTADIQILQKASKYLSSLYIDSVVKNLSSFSTESEGQIGKAFVSSKETGDWSGLQLLATDEIENQLLLDGYVSKCEGRLTDVLYALQRRVECVSSVKELKGSKNPYGPYVLLNTYVELIKGESFSKEAHKILCESFSKAVLTDLGDVLEEINNLFIQAGVLPTLPKPKIERSKAVDKKETKSFVNEKVARVAPEQLQSNEAATTEQPVTAPMMPVAEIEPALYSSLVEMAQAFRTQGGDKIVSDGLVVSGKLLPTTDLVDTLTNLQKNNAVDGTHLKESVRLQIGSSIQVDGQRRPYAEQDDTLIDVVAMFFDVILQDRHLPDTVRAMIAQLQIPILKVAMMDKEFFAKKSHPARKFLNALSQAGLGVSEKNKQIKNAVFEKMEELVSRVLMDFDNDVEIFAELFEEFDIFMEQQQRQIDVIEERSRKVTQSTERLELMKRQAAYEIALRLNGKAIPEFVQLFLDDAWKDVLVLALLRRDKEPAETQQSLDVIERLIISVTKPDDEVAKDAIIGSLSRLLKDLKVGLENISYDFHESAPFFKELESWHRRLLAVTAGEQDDIPLAEEVVLVEFDDSLCAISLEEDLLQELESELSQMPDDKFSKRANNMQVGDWVEYQNAEGAMMRAKLSWKSAVTMQCLFVNDRGAKALDISVADFAEGLRQKRMSLIGQEKAPLVERVLLGMKKLISFGGTETSPA